MTLYPQIIIDALATVTYAGTKKNLIDSEMVADTPVVSAPSSPGEPWKVKVVLEFPRDTDPFLKSTVKSAEAAIKYHCKKLAEESGDTEFSNDVEVEIATEFKSAPRPEVGQMLPGVKNIIAVSSGKGGVGKSTVSANLAIALARLGYKVGLLDTDIFGPSMPKMFDVEDERPYAVKKDGRDLICPIEKYGVKLLSIGFFVSPTTATLWRGGMATSALKQLMSTPQQVALADARKGIDMYRNEKVNVPILGLIENMAWFTPAELPENRYYIFGKEGCKNLAEEMNVPLLAQIPLVQSICENGDAGSPAALSSDTATGIAFINLAQAVVTVVNRRNKEQPKTKIVGMSH